MQKKKKSGMVSCVPTNTFQQLYNLNIIVIFRLSCHHQLYNVRLAESERSKTSVISIQGRKWNKCLSIKLVFMLSETEASSEIPMWVMAMCISNKETGWCIFYCSDVDFLFEKVTWVVHCQPEGKSFIDCCNLFVPWSRL